MISCPCHSFSSKCVDCLGYQPNSKLLCCLTAYRLTIRYLLRNSSVLLTGKKNEKCPECGAELVIRSGKHGPFLSCSNYPQCQHIRSLKPVADGHIVKILEGKACPECGKQLVLRQGRYGMFIGCRDYPQCHHIESMDKPDSTTIACPQCKKSFLLQRRSRFGKTFYACDRYPECQFIINLKPIQGECSYCHYPLLVEKRTVQGTKLFCANKQCAKPVGDNIDDERKD